MQAGEQDDAREVVRAVHAAARGVARHLQQPDALVVAQRVGGDAGLEVNLLPREFYAFGEGKVESVGSAWPGHPASTPAIASCSACVTHSRYFAFTATCRAT